MVGFAGQAIETGANLIIDKSAEAVARSAAIPGGPLAGAVGTGGAKEGQENLQQAAIHLWEAGELLDSLRGRIEKYNDRVDEGDLCGAVVDILAEIYKLKHHLVRAQKPLEEAIEMVEACVGALDKDFPRLKKGHNDLLRCQ